VAGVGGSQPLVVAGMPVPRTAAPFLQVGQQYAGEIRSANGGLIVALGDITVPLRGGQASIRPGMQVLVEVSIQNGAKSLRVIAPQPAGQQPPASSTAPSVSLQPPSGTGRPGAGPQAFAPQTGGAVHDKAGGGELFSKALTQALRALDATRQAPELARIISPQAPQTPAAQQIVAAALLVQGGIADDLQRVTHSVRHGAQSGALPRSKAAAVIALIAGLVIEDGGDVEAVLHRLRQNATQSFESRLARVLGSGDSMDQVFARTEDLRGQLMDLLRNDNFTRQLRDAGLFREFEQAARNLLDRFAGVQLQNTRALDFPYLFLQLPFDPAGGIRHGRLHILGEGRGDGMDKDNASLILDLDTTNLGPVLIALGLTHGRCTCTIRAVDEAAVDMFEAHADDLKEALSRAGFPGATVQATSWDGDAIAALAEEFAGGDGLDVSA